jgi:excisionase family DNA binding protein
MPQIMTTKELAKYLKLHEITICKYAADGRIPAIRIGRVWRFDKEAIDKLIGEGTAPANKVGSKENGKGMKQ